MRIALAGGGTGGHIMPLIAIVEALRQERQDLHFLWLGCGRLAEDSARRHKINFQKIVSGKWRRYFALSNFFDFFKIPVGIFQSFFLLLGFGPDVVFSKGGFIGLPVVIAAWLLRKKIILHESDARMGLANRLSSRFAQKVLIGFPLKERLENKKYLCVGSPVRKEFTQTQGLPKKAGEFKRPMILVSGGSLGARFLNQLVKKVRSRLKEYQIIHLVGPKHSPPSSTQHYQAHCWLEAKAMARAYKVADLVIARAGATSLSEIAFLGKPSILIPLAQGYSPHQEANAEVFAKAGAAIVFAQEDLDPKKFVQAVHQILQDREKREAMSTAAKSLARPQALKKIALEILNTKNEQAG